MAQATLGSFRGPLQPSGNDPPSRCWPGGSLPFLTLLSYLVTISLAHRKLSSPMALRRTRSLGKKKKKRAAIQILTRAYRQPPLVWNPRHVVNYEERSAGKRRCTPYDALRTMNALFGQGNLGMDQPDSSIVRLPLHSSIHVKDCNFGVALWVDAEAFVVNIRSLLGRNSSHLPCVLPYITLHACSTCSGAERGDEHKSSCSSRLSQASKQASKRDGGPLEVDSGRWTAYVTHFRTNMLNGVLANKGGIFLVLSLCAILP